MSYKWGHPLATLPVTNGTIRHTRRMIEILRIMSWPAVTTAAGTLQYLVHGLLFAYYCAMSITANS
eukprot:2193188-Pleurochrysis_carterae.AAC.2